MIVFLHFLLEEVVKQKSQKEQYKPHIHCLDPAQNFASPSDAVENVSQPRSNRHKTVMHSAIAAI